MLSAAVHLPAFFSSLLLADSGKCRVNLARL
jgi:hypothetical protein